MSEFMHAVEQCPACGETRCTPNRDALRESHAELLAAATDIVRRPVGPFGRDDSTAEERLEYALNRLFSAIAKAEAING